MAYIGTGLVVGLGLVSELGIGLGRVVRIRQAIYWHGVKWGSPKTSHSAYKATNIT